MEEKPKITLTEFILLADLIFALIMSMSFTRTLAVLPVLIESLVFAIIDSKNKKLARGYKLLPLWILFSLAAVAAAFPEKSSPRLFRFIEKIHYLDI